MVETLLQRGQWAFLFQVALICASLFTTVISQSDTSPGIYNSSTTPSNLPWNTYNYCNDAHVNAGHYEAAAEGKLVYAVVMMRHHKRTPDNLYPNENELNPAAGWNCTDFLQFNYGGGTAPVYHETYIPASQPFLSMIWNGTCDEGQVTAGGLEDAVKHGQDFWSVYGTKLGFLTSVDDIWIRTSTEDRTQQSAGGLLYGMDPSSAFRSFAVYTQPETIDSLVPNYPCTTADNVRDAYQSVPAWTDHLVLNADLQTRLGDMLGTANLTAWTSWYDHYFDTFSSRTCNGHPLPCNSSGACVSQEDADRVFAIGNFEYNYIWNTAQNSAEYNQLTFGVMFSELASNFRSFQEGLETHRMRLYVGHDGSMIRLASGLGLGKVAPLNWPALGSELVMEVWVTYDGSNYVRVIHGGTPVEGMERIPLESFIDLLEAQVPENIFEVCQGTS